MIQAVIFDLDDTLYPESDFVTSGYRAVAHYVAENYGCAFDNVFSTMMTAFVSQGRKMVLPVLIDRFLDPTTPLADLIEVYRKHSPQIRLFPGYLELLERLSRQYRLGIITDGVPEVQKRKVQALQLDSIIDRIIYTWEYGLEKPHPLPFSLMMEFLHTGPATTLFVGDNPEKDCKGAHGVGMRCVQLQNPILAGGCGAGGGEEAEFVIDSVYQLPPILEQMN